MRNAKFHYIIILLLFSYNIGFGQSSNFEHFWNLYCANSSYRHNVNKFVRVGVQQRDREFGACSVKELCEYQYLETQGEDVSYLEECYYGGNATELGTCNYVPFLKPKSPGVKRSLAIAYGKWLDELTPRAYTACIEYTAYSVDPNVDANINIPTQTLNRNKPNTVQVVIGFHADKIDDSQGYLQRLDIAYKYLDTMMVVTLKVGSREFSKTDTIRNFLYGDANKIPVTLNEVDIKNSQIAIVGTVKLQDFPDAENYEQLKNNTHEIIADVDRSCRVSEIKKRPVQFMSQANPTWATEPYAFNTDSSANLQNLGCVVSSLAMLFDFYGLNRLSNNIETGSPKVLFTPVVNNQLTDPMSLNTILKGIQDLRSSDSYVEGYRRDDNNPIYENVAHAGRAAYQLQCHSNTKLTAPCLIDKQSCITKCIEESKSKISYIGNSKYSDGSPKNGHSRFGTTNGYLKSTATEAERNALQAEQEDAFKRIEKEICDGNPVLLRVAKERQFDDKGNEKLAAGHTVLVTESFYDSTGKLSFRLNDPRSKFKESMENIDLKTLKTRDDHPYPHIIGYDIYRPEKDPSMIRVSSSDNMHFVLTDTEGRRAGFDPITKTTYNEIPNAVYSYERIEPNIEPWEIFNEKLSLGAYNLFLSDDVKSGNYQVEAFGISNGKGNLSISKTDVDGFNTDSEKHSFEVFKGFQKIINFKHSDQPIPIATTDLIINYARYDQINVKVHGELKLLNDYKVNCADTIKINIGALTDYNLSLPISAFTKKTYNGQDFYEYATSDYKITLQSSGYFWIDVFNIDLQNIQQDNKGKFAMTINNQVGRTNLNLSCTNNTCYGEQRK